MDSEAAGVHEAYEQLYVSPNCSVQTAESRFGAHVLDDLGTFVNEGPHDNDMVFDDDEDDGEVDEEDDALEEGVFAELYDWSPALGGGAGLETDPNHAQHGFPRIATTRHNLTALSQRFNLYFAAYQDRIYVYQPRRAGPQILPPPSLILHPRPSKLGDECGGFLDQRFPHQINHIVVGNLGALEIVVLAYDDGDTIAYYTHSIVRCIRANSDQVRGPGASPGRQGAHLKPFFHENVGKTAWGLAIHEQSRLIAVSSNLHEVTVFAFALSHVSAAVKIPELEFSPTLPCGKRAFELQRHIQSRTRTWRIILPLGRGGNNIPNISFLDDDAGDAERVVAIDIGGTVWLLDIWRIGTLPIRWPDSDAREQQMVHGVRGWGVLVLPYSSFRPTKTVRESLGVPGGEVMAVMKSEETNRVWLDTTCSLYYIKGFSSNPDTIFRQRHTRLDYGRTHAAKPEFQEEDLSDTYWSESESEDEGVCMTTSPGALGKKPAYTAALGAAMERWSTVTAFSGRSDSSFEDLSDETQLSRCIIPSFGETPPLDGNPSRHTLFSRMQPDRQRRTKHIEFSKADVPSHLAKDYCILRTSPTDVELLPFNRDAPCVECKCLLTHHNHTGVAAPWDLHPAYSERVSMLLHVPELSLVVTGSPTGRVALLTLTKTAKKLYNTELRHGFRVDCVLPRKAEDGKKLRPGCTLIGVAISPVPYRPGKGLELRPERGGRETAAAAAAAPVMYRLMLHYKNHTILMYDVSRGGEEDELLVF
ncbi:hypothetical protein C8A00DRAFT_15379 [Chaetomidium leptoderma]|uniref:Pyridine nucleotide-disulfide oxidoreductase family protein n=1 Tax=Chaetomidium leptoderma TaxID=669021 RepID=A0AAN6VKT4_9PEZI|nr:hypothetical protein C8A00DRAFT_15379 [Chaetomidium leptoderma]